MINYKTPNVEAESPSETNDLNELYLLLASSNQNQVKPMTYQIDTCRHLAWCLVLIGYDKARLTQDQDNMTCGISGHGARGLVSQWGTTLRSQ